MIRDEEIILPKCDGCGLAANWKKESPGIRAQHLCETCFGKLPEAEQHEEWVHF